MKASVPFRFRFFQVRIIPREQLREGGPIELLSSVGNEGGASIDESDEAATLRFISARPDLLALLLGQLGLCGQTFVDVGVTRPFLRRSGEGGDIDLLAIRSKDPRQAIAFQAKRFKVKIRDVSEEVCLDSQKLDDLIRQCNATVDLGFHQVYGLVLVMNDGRLHPAASLLHRGASPNTFRRLYHFVRSRPLDHRVGMVFVEMVQPTPADFSEVGLFSVGVDRFAKLSEQKSELSEKIAKYAAKLDRAGKVVNITMPPLDGDGVSVRAEDPIGVRLVRRGSRVSPL